MAEKNFDVVVIGGGPGGYVCAIRAAQLGLNVCVVERAHLGGVCLNWGCIPTKALLKASEVYTTIKDHAADFGFKKVTTPEVDVKKLIGRSREVAGKLAGGVEYLMKKNKITVIEGAGRFISQNVLGVFDAKGAQIQKIQAENFVIATGARARQIKGVMEADGQNIWTAKEAMTPEKMPKSLVIIGAGAIGIEFASFYRAFGVEVSVIEAQDRILPAEDAEISALAAKSFTDRGIKLFVNTAVEAMHATKTGVEVKVKAAKGTQALKAEKALIAIGVVGNVEGLGLDVAGVRVDKGYIHVDSHYRTGAKGVWAIGDVIGAPWLAHVASHEGVLCAEALAGHIPHKMDYQNVPGCTYCTPQIASVGMSEAAAKAKGYSVKVGRFQYQANGKAIASGHVQGLVKTVFDATTNALLGAHIIGADATEMISTFVLGRHMEVTAEDFARACLPHPTLSEMLAESVLDSQGIALHT